MEQNTVEKLTRIARRIEDGFLREKGVATPAQCMEEIHSLICALLTDDNLKGK